MVSMHCFNTTFGIPLVPITLNGFSLPIALPICSFDSGRNSKVLGRYACSSSSAIGSLLGAGKNVSNSIFAFCLFIVALHVPPFSLLEIHVCTLVPPLSMASMDASLWAVQTVFSLIWSRKSSQWSFFNCSIVLAYQLHIFQYLSCASSPGLCLFIYACHPRCLTSRASTTPSSTTFSCEEKV